MRFSQFQSKERREIGKISGWGRTTVVTRDGRSRKEDIDNASGLGYNARRKKSGLCCQRLDLISVAAQGN